MQPVPQHSRSQILAERANASQNRGGIAQPQPQQLSPMYYPENTSLEASLQNLNLDGVSFSSSLSPPKNHSQKFLITIEKTTLT